jgi:hypothetical protein
MGIGLENLSTIKGKYSDKGREISLFSYLYVMNLLSILTELITEDENRRKFLGRFVFGLDDIKLFSSGHQSSDRMGEMDFDEIRDFYFCVVGWFLYFFRQKNTKFLLICEFYFKDFKSR